MQIGCELVSGNWPIVAIDWHPNRVCSGLTVAENGCVNGVWAEIVQSVSQSISSKRWNCATGQVTGETKNGYTNCG